MYTRLLSLPSAPHTSPDLFGDKHTEKTIFDMEAPPLKLMKLGEDPEDLSLFSSIKPSPERDVKNTAKSISKTTKSTSGTAKSTSGRASVNSISPPFVVTKARPPKILTRRQSRSSIQNLPKPKPLRTDPEIYCKSLSDIYPLTKHLQNGLLDLDHAQTRSQRNAILSSRGETNQAFPTQTSFEAQLALQDDVFTHLNYVIDLIRRINDGARRFIGTQLPKGPELKGHPRSFKQTAQSRPITGPHNYKEQQIRFSIPRFFAPEHPLDPNKEKIAPFIKTLDFVSNIQTFDTQLLVTAKVWLPMQASA